MTHDFSTVACRRCQAEIVPELRRCAACGAALPGSLSHSASQASVPGHTHDALRTNSDSAPAPRAVIDNPYAVLAAVFLATAVFGIPLIWMCRAWSPAVKGILTILTLAYTALILWLFSLVMLWCWERIAPHF